MIKEKRRIVVCEYISTGINFVDDIRARGYEPVLLEGNYVGTEEETAPFREARATINARLRDSVKIIPDGGRLVMENPIPAQVISILNKKYEENHADTERSYDSEYKRMNIHYPDQNVTVSIRIYDRDEYIEMFEASGLKLMGSYSEHFTPYDESKMRMILIAEKEAVSG